ncbi:MAG: hydrogenase nickel incorporation protein HypA [Candidatus Methanomethylophilaceae archaeon]|nr:hydrogenase nickel incorporation protein HypA [Candidatus Methanomethylophilaceae archaeon]MDD3378830.1 hydrogenase nickel incorporation protein HypA [Candidatus Methanomethylophilaceae archaeon]MDY0224292.1 hydrogenase nickel incorporation protein HypA [Candidatus Methanomethylophilaceae archaeon]
MSEEHNHKHNEDCHCQECEDKRNGGEKTSMEEAGGVAVGFVGHFHGWNSDAEARLTNALIVTGKWVEKESGCLLGHIKCAVYHDDGSGITLNLTDLDNGVEHHGVIDPCEEINFNFMAAVLDVDPHELEHIMMHAIEDTGIDYQIKEGHHHHHHDDDDEHCCCGDSHEHHHHHDDDNDGEECHCKACEDRRKEEASKQTTEKKSIWDKIRRK